MQREIPYPKVWQRSVDVPVRVRDVSPDADGNVIPEGSQIKMALVSMNNTKGQSKCSLHQNAR